GAFCVVVAESIRQRLKVREGFYIRLLLRCVHTARGEGDVYGIARSSSSLFNRSRTTKHDQVSEGNLLAALCLLVEVGTDAFQHVQNAGQFGRVVNSPAVLRVKANTAAIGTAAHVGCTEGRCRSPCCTDQFLRG